MFTAPEWNEQMKVPDGRKREDAFIKGIKNPYKYC